MKFYVLKYKNFYMHYGFSDEYGEEYLTRESTITNATLYENVEDIKCILKDLKEENITIFAKKDEKKEIKNKTYILEVELKEIGEINNG